MSFLFTSVFPQAGGFPATTTSTTTTVSASTSSTTTSSGPSPLYETDFTEASPLDDWTGVWDAADLDLTIVNSSATNQIGSKAMNVDENSSTNGTRYYSYDPAGTVTDCQILVAFRGDMVSGWNIPLRIYWRASGTLASADCYCVNISGGLGDFVRLVKIVNGSASAITGTGEDGLNFFNTSDVYFLRIDVNGNTMKGKIWNANYIEPVEWGWEKTDSAHSSGTVGVGGWGANGSVDVEYFAVTTDMTQDIPVPALTAGTRSQRLTTLAPFSTLYADTFNEVRLFPFIVPEALNGKYLSSMGWYIKTNNSENVRVAAYVGTDKTDPTDATLIEDLGEVSPGSTGAFTTANFSTPRTQVSTGDVIYLGIKANGGGTDILYTDTNYRLMAGAQLVNGSGRWNATAGISSDETVAWPADLSGATLSQNTYWFFCYVQFDDTAS